MKSTFRLCAVSIFAAFLGIGCSGGQPSDQYQAKAPDTVPAATVTPGNEGSLFPLDKGNQWTYSVDVKTKLHGKDQPVRSYESNWKVIDSKQTSDGTVAQIQTTLPKNKIDVQTWREDSKGIYEVSDGTPPVTFNPPFPMILFPVKDGTVYKWQGTGPNGTKGGGKQTSTRTIRASEVVDTDMGQMSAIPVDDVGTIEANGKQGRSESTVWFAPGVGIVRLRQEVVIGDQGYILLLKLKSKSLMKS